MHRHHDLCFDPMSVVDDTRPEAGATEAGTTRRGFVVRALATLSLLAANGGCARRVPATRADAGPAPADLILVNGRIATLSAARPTASAIAIKDGVFITVGSDRDAMAHRVASTTVVDGGRRTVVPGLNDSHTHLIRGGLNYNLELRWDGTPSLADGLRMVRDQAQRTPPPHWVRIVGGWSK